MNKVKQNEKDAKIAIVAANSHYGGYAPETVDMHRENMDMQKLSFDNVEIAKINRQLELEIDLKSAIENKVIKESRQLYQISLIKYT